MQYIAMNSVAKVQQYGNKKAIVRPFFKNKSSQSNYIISFHLYLVLIRIRYQTNSFQIERRTKNDEFLCKKSFRIYDFRCNFAPK